MSADPEAQPLPSPWREFLSELDDLLTEPLELHCIGGFVLTLFYGLPRTTGDILVPDPYDCILSKIERASPKDRDDADYLFRSQKLDAEVLRRRYRNELRHNLIGNIAWHDQTLELWIDIFTAPR